MGQAPAGGDDVTDRRGLHDEQPGVVGDPVIVVGGSLVRLQALPDLPVQQLGNSGHLCDELPPARQRDHRLQLRVFAVLRLGGHHGLSASANGSKIGIGITFASGVAALGLVRYGVRLGRAGGSGLISCLPAGRPLWCGRLPGGRAC